ncbi:MAG TPA: patatin-like phospholipase family protein [Burkholderiales bacterium]|nr:patatin-like phospholipase family protein [Burkholderiales bacterium]
MRTFAGCVAFAIATLAARAQPEAAAADAPQPPRIGLALSGGGARGLAHVGVLKVLEELRVPVHCITGTSIGSIVGATYASGAPVAEMEKYVIEADWSDIFRDQPPRTEISSRRKLDDYKTLFAPEYGVKESGLALPKGVIAGVAIEGFFRRLTGRAIAVEDFRKLPIPFNAVAADIETGEAVVLERGSLSQAMRASMAVPGALAPVEIDGRLLVDGGIANNLPIDEARKLCADVVIAVNIGTPPLRRDEITSALSVAAQLVNFLGKANVDRQLKSLGGRDVLIAPDLGDISSGNFERAADVIRVGEEAARKMADLLRRYSLPPEQYAALRSRQTIERSGLGSVDEIRFEGLQRTNPEVLRSLLQSKPGETLTEETVSADLRRIYGRGDFESIDYRIQQEPGGRVLVISPREKEWGPDYLRFGIGFATDFQGDNVFNVLATYRRTWLNRLGGEWLTQAQIGTNSYLLTEFYQPVDDRGRYFVAPYARISQDFRGLFDGDNRVAEYEIEENRLGFDAGAVLGTWGEVRLGALWRRVDAKVDTGPQVLPSVKETTAGPRALLYLDRLDNAWFPREGFRATGSAYMADDAFGSDIDYKRLEGQLTAATSFGAHTLNLGVSGGTDLGTDMPAYDTFTLGGPLRLSGYRINEFSGRRTAFGRLMYYNRTISLPEILGSGVYAGASLEAGQVRTRFDNLSTGGTIWSGSAFLAADTFAGPAYFGIGLGESGRWSLYLLIGAP